MLAYYAIHIYRLYIIVRLRSKPRQLSITRHMLPIQLRQLSILSRLRSNHYSPTNYLTPTRLPARICASLRSFKCGDSAARPAACSFTYLRVKKIPTPFGVGIFLTGSYLSSQAASSQVLSTYKGLTTVFGMGTGGSP